MLFENGELPIDCSSGSPVLNADGQIVGLYRFKKEGSNLCLAVSAIELQNFGYEICDGERTCA